MRASTVRTLFKGKRKAQCHLWSKPPLSITFAFDYKLLLLYLMGVEYWFHLIVSMCDSLKHQIWKYSGIMHPQVFLPHPLILSIPVKHPQYVTMTTTVLSLLGMDVSSCVHYSAPIGLSPPVAVSESHWGVGFVYRLKGRHSCWVWELIFSRGVLKKKYGSTSLLLFQI